MLKLFFITIFFNIQFIEILKKNSFSFNSSSLKHFFFITHKMSRSITNRLNTINDFLIDIENNDVIILSKSNLDDELIKIDTIKNEINYTQFLSFIKKKFKKF